MKPTIRWRDRLEATSGPTAQELLTHARLFIKLDLAYFVALGAAITALQLTGDDLTHAAIDFSPVPIIFAVVIWLDALIYATFYGKWVGQNEKYALVTGRALQVLARVQPLWHTVLVTMVLTGVHAYAQGEGAVLNYYDGVATIQTLVKYEAQKTGKVPTSISDLKGSAINRALAEIGGVDQVRLEPFPEGKFLLTFAGKDKVFGTPDDEAYSSDIDLAAVFAEITSKRTSKSKNKQGTTD